MPTSMIFPQDQNSGRSDVQDSRQISMYVLQSRKLRLCSGQDQAKVIQSFLQDPPTETCTRTHRQTNNQRERGGARETDRETRVAGN